MNENLNRKEFRKLSFSLNLVAVFNFYRKMGVFAAAIIFLFGRNFFTEFAGNFIAEKFNVG